MSLISELLVLLCGLATRIPNNKYQLSLLIVAMHVTNTQINYTGWTKRTWHFTFVHMFAIDRFSKFFQGHTLQTICDNELLHISPHSKCISTLPCKISIKYTYDKNNNKQTFWQKLKKKHFRPTLQWMVCMTLNCVGLRQSSVIQIIHRNVNWSEVFFIYLNFCYYH